MKRVSAVALVLVILVVGFLAGALSAHLYYARQLRPPGSFALMASELFALQLDRELGLSADQRAQIGRILHSTRIEAEALREDVRPRIGRLMSDAGERIEEVLTDEQRRRFAELRGRYRERSQHFLLGPPGCCGPRHRPWPGHGRSCRDCPPGADEVAPETDG